MHPFLTIPFKKQELINQTEEFGEDFIDSHFHGTEYAWATFGKKYPYILSEGYIYSTSLANRMHGVIMHGAIDYYVPYGTNIYSPVDGYISASYNIQRSKNRQWEIRSVVGRKITYGLGFCTQIYVPEQKTFLLFGHLSSIAPQIPYLEPIANEEGERFARWFNLSEEHLKNIEKLSRMQPIKKGEFIGTVGVSGVHVTNTFPPRDGRPETVIEQDETPYYWYSHLHRNTYTRSTDGEKQMPIDPYDLYGSVEEYPDPSRPTLMLWENHLMLVGEDGLPLCVDE